jgi:hypothetical protein
MDDALDEWIDFIAEQEQKYLKMETHPEENLQRSLKKTLTLANFSNTTPERMIRRSAKRQATIKYNSMVKKGGMGKTILSNAMFSNEKMNEILKEDEDNYRATFEKSTGNNANTEENSIYGAHIS